MLARLNANQAVEASYLAWDGTRLLIQGAAGASDATLLEAAREAVAERELQPTQLPDEQARREWAARHDTAVWVAGADLWRLSWREAETFAARLTAALSEQVGEEVAALEPLLVESFFEGVRPPDGSGPVSTHWPPGATVQARQRVIFARAAELLDEPRLEALRALLASREQVGKLISGEGQQPAD